MGGLAQERLVMKTGPLLSDEAQLAYYVLLLAEAEDYKTLKDKILAHCGLSSMHAVAEFHKWSYKARTIPRTQMNMLLHTAKRWWKLEWLTATEVMEQVAMD